VTNIQNYGMFIDAGSGCVIEWNNIYDLYTPRLGGYADDVDAVRFWATTYSATTTCTTSTSSRASRTAPATHHIPNCFQTYNNGTDSVGTVIEDNYCVRVSRQCLIAQNDTDKRYFNSHIWFRNNVCETYDSQSINLGSMKGVHIHNNLILSGFRYQVVSLEEQDTGLANTTRPSPTNVLVRAKKSAFTYERSERRRTSISATTWSCSTRPSSRGTRHSSPPASVRASGRAISRRTGNTCRGWR